MAAARQGRRIAAGGGGAPGAAAPVAEGAWYGQGLTRGQLHEVYAGEAADAAAATGFSVALALAAAALPLLWIRTEAAERQAGRTLAGGLAELGLPPSALMLVVTADEPALLRTAADAARCAGVGTVLIESWGLAPGLDLTATRRLMLGAEASGVTVLSVRLGADPVPSAAASRWRVAAAGSTALAADAPGGPAFEIECLRRRGGPAGWRGRVEWNRDARCFVPPEGADTAGGVLPHDAAPLSGAGLPLAADRAAAQRPAAPVRRAG
ncbi:hypothetical protein Q5H91_09435 [Sphingomonas sp. KR1UV-12]|uniref:Protein ImuA n=1 Tax=Sphingomonas aurea TaxID=3063994 RepID=A0ABT9EKX5_9SPHN|nr:hypothetical protein [Sphingomonas sp. KR1UV-12]MDP1027433.1 hypothetical protein [Sphingomonas sp. KR1UV-12]